MIKLGPIFNRWYRVGVLVAIIIVFGILENSVGSGLIKPALERLMNPVRVQVVSLGQRINFLTKSIWSNTNKAERIEELELKYAKALARVALLEYLEDENLQLKEMLDSPTRNTSTTIITTPILSLSYPAVQGGAADGINLGSVVMFQNTLLGTIAEVSLHQSKVWLLTQTNSPKILAKTEGGVQGLIMGDGQKVLLTQIPKNKQVAVGQSVTTVGQSGVSPNLFIGTVQSIQSVPESPTQTAVIEQLVSFYTAKIVEVQK